jgi:hypothetical protein
MVYSAGESESDVVWLDFDRRLMLQFRGFVITSDAGLLAYRELDDALGLTAPAGETLADVRTGKNGRHALVGLLRQSVFGRLAGYEDVNDGRRPPRGIVLDMDSNVSQTHGDQENSVWNSHYACTCYHPLFVFNQFGDLERCTLRPGNVHSADDWKNVFKPVVSRDRGNVSRIYFRADAAFATPAVYEFLEAERIKYAIRLPGNQVLQERIGYLLKRPVGRPPNEVRRFYANFTYQAGSWIKPRRVIAKVEWHPGELYPRVGFIVTT